MEMTIDVFEYKRKVEKFFIEAAEDILSRLDGQRTLMGDGKSATIRTFFRPMVGGYRHDPHLRGVVHFGFDVKFDDGSGHIEFLCYQSGWGCSVNSCGVNLMPAPPPVKE